MNDIEVLEEFIKYYEVEATSRKFRGTLSISVGEDDIQAIENLLKERQSDKERIKHLEEQLKGRIDKSQKLIEVTNLYLNSISKSLIKEKIEELNKRIEQYDEYSKKRIETDVEFYENIADTAIVQVLEELLKEDC